MARSVSDIIEQFIIDTIADSEHLNISRSQMADLFNCVPSQINYVLSTRFTIDKGYIVESRRGGGGFITIIKLPTEKYDYLSSLISDKIGQKLDVTQANRILDRLQSEKIITDTEKNIITAAISEKSLIVPDNIKDSIRASIFKSILIALLKS